MPLTPLLNLLFCFPRPNSSSDAGFILHSVTFCLFQTHLPLISCFRAFTSTTLSAWGFFFTQQYLWSLIRCDSDNIGYWSTFFLLRYKCRVSLSLSEIHLISKFCNILSCVVILHRLTRLRKFYTWNLKCTMDIDLLKCKIQQNKSDLLIT